MEALRKELIKRGYTSDHNEHFSTLGKIGVVYSKGNKEVVLGLNEYGKPPTLIRPRPFKGTSWDNRNYQIFDDDEMNRYLNHYSGEEILNCIEGNLLIKEL